MPHPATMFFLLTLGIIFLSWIFDVYGLNVRLPQTGEEIRVQSLLSPEGLRWLLRHVVTNFTGFAPLGLVIVAMFGIGVAQQGVKWTQKDISAINTRYRYIGNNNSAYGMQPYRMK